MWLQINKTKTRSTPQCNANRHTLLVPMKVCEHKYHIVQYCDLPFTPGISPQIAVNKQWRYVGV